MGQYNKLGQLYDQAGRTFNDPTGSPSGPPAVAGGTLYPLYIVEIAFTGSQPGVGGFILDQTGLDSTSILGGSYSSAVFQTMTGVGPISIHYGRQQENAQIEPGRITVTLDNGDGRFSPDNPNSPYWPNVVSGRLIRISASYRGVAYPLCVGYIQSFQPVDNGPVDGNVVITAYDFLGKLGRIALNHAFPAQDEGARIRAVMNLVNDNGFTRYIDTGPDTLLGQSFSSAIGVGTAPTAGPALAALAATGSPSSLAAGTYSVAYSWVDTTGRETSASPGTAVTIAGGQIISVTGAALPAGYASMNVYASLTPGSAAMGYVNNVIGSTYTINQLPVGTSAAPPTASGQNTTAAQHIQDILTAERGIYYVDSDGSYHYENRHYRFITPRSLTPQAQFGQPDENNRMTPGVLPYTALDYIYDDRDIYNDVHVKASNTTELEVVARDQASIDLFDTKTLSVQSQCMPPGMAALLAPWLLAGYKDQHSRITALTVNGDNSDGSNTATDIWIQILTRKISDMIHVHKSRPASMHIERDVWIEGITHNILPDIGGHTVTWQLGETIPYNSSGGAGVWNLGVSGLDTSATLATF